MFIVVGLGNPGDKYAHTYHNLGFLAVSYIADTLKIKFSKHECNSITASCIYHNEHVVLAKPLTYVNESGKAVKELLSKYHSNLADVIVISDDFNLTKFNTRARFGGGDGGHNGLKSIISNCDNGFFRIRIGLDRKIEDFKELVLSKIDESDYPLYVESFAKIADGLTLFFRSNDIDLMMRTINKQ